MDFSAFLQLIFTGLGTGESSTSYSLIFAQIDLCKNAALGLVTIFSKFVGA